MAFLLFPGQYPLFTSESSVNTVNYFPTSFLYFCGKFHHFKKNRHKNISLAVSFQIFLKRSPLGIPPNFSKKTPGILKLNRQILTRAAIQQSFSESLFPSPRGGQMAGRPLFSYPYQRFDCSPLILYFSPATSFPNFSISFLIKTMQKKSH